MYRTTRKFLEYFGLRDLSDLPTLEDFKESELEDQVSQNQTALPFGESPSESLDEEDSVTESDAESETQPTEPADPDSSTVS